MSDSRIDIRVDADVTAAKQALADVTQQTKELGETVERSSKVSAGSILQLSGSVISVKNGLSSLSSGRGGVGSILQIASGARIATGAVKGMGVAGSAAGAFIAASLGVAAAAVAGVSMEMRKNSVGIDQWKKESTGAIDWVFKKFSDLNKARKDWYDNTAVGAYFVERKEQKQQAEVAAAKEAIDEAIRTHQLTGNTLKAELKAAEAAGDAAKVAELYARVLQEAENEKKRAEKEEQEAQDLRNFWEAGSPEAIKNRERGKEQERKEGAIIKAKEIAKDQEMGASLKQRMQKIQELAEKAKPMNAAAAQLAGFKGGGAVDANAQRQLDQAIAGFAKAGGTVEQLVAGLDGGAMGDPDKIINALENLESVLPKDFARDFINAIKLEPVKWN